MSKLQENWKQRLAAYAVSKGSYPLSSDDGSSDEPASSGVVRTRPKGRHCQWCGASLVNKRPQAKFCDDACRLKAWRDSKKHSREEQA